LWGGSAPLACAFGARANPICKGWNGPFEHGSSFLQFVSGKPRWPVVWELNS
jgi:hypothetical protein